MFANDSKLLVVSNFLFTFFIFTYNRAYTDPYKTPSCLYIFTFLTPPRDGCQL